MSTDRILRAAIAHFVPAHLQTRSYEAHASIGNTVEAIARNVQNALAEEGSVSNFQTPRLARAAVLPPDTLGLAFTFVPARDISVYSLGRKILYGANYDAVQRQMPPEAQWKGERSLYLAFATGAFATQYLPGPEPEAPCVTEEEIVATPAVQSATSSRTLLGRVLSVATTGATGELNAVTDAKRALNPLTGDAPWLGPVVVGAMVVIGLLAVGYALRPVAALVAEAT